MSGNGLFDPFSNETYNELVKGFLRPFRFEFSPPAPAMKLEVSEKDNTYVVKAEVPGVRKEDISVKIEGDRVSISAESKKQTDEKEGGKVLRSEFTYGSIFREFSLGGDVDAEKATATYQNGVLELTLPKRAAAPSHQLQVQ